MDTTRKSSSDEIKSIYFLSGSMNSARACRMYEFKIRITGAGKESGRDEKIETIKAKVEIVGKPRLIQDFFDQTLDRDRDGNFNLRIVYTASGAALPGHPGSFLLIPNEYSQPDELYMGPNLDISRIPSLTYNVLTAETSHFSDFPHQRKAYPFVISLNNKVYVLSCPRFLHDCIVEPSFEVFDPSTYLWSALDTPPFSRNPAKGHEATGYAVYKDSIVVSVVTHLRRTSRCSFCSYHTLTKQWKRVHIAPSEASYRPWRGEAVVANGAIYGYLCGPILVAYLLSENLDGSLSLGLQTQVEGVCQDRKDTSFDPSVAIGKIGDRLLCEISTIYPRKIEKQRVWISFYYVYKHGHFLSLGSSKYTMPCDDQFFLGTFLYFLDMQPGGDHNEELGGEKSLERFEDYDRAKASNVQMMESAMEDVPE